MAATLYLFSDDSTAAAVKSSGRFRERSAERLGVSLPLFLLADLGVFDLEELIISSFG